jgi:hypothetical protein
MGLLLRPWPPAPEAGHTSRTPVPIAPEEGSAARGIMVALAFSAIAWIGLALLVPRLW